MNDFLNPYIAGAPVVEPSMFFGRQDVFDWIEQNLSGRFVNHILVIHGQRRVGKTSVLKQLPNHLPAHFIHVFFDLQGRTHTSLDRFQWWLAREICRAINQTGVSSISLPERDMFTQDGEFLVTTFFPEVLSRLGESILLLTFDEFDILSEPDIQESLSRPLITYLRSLFDLPNLNFIFSIGSSGHKLENMQASYTEFFKTALYRKISFLKQEDCSKLITQPVQGVLEFELPAVKRIYDISSGHPYFTQLICHELFSLSQKTDRKRIIRADVESVLEDVIERGTVNLKFVWDEANDLEKWVLSTLAHQLQEQETNQPASLPGKRPACTDRQIAAALHNQRVRCSESDLNTALVHLREKDVLTQDNRFVVELLCVWLVKNRPLDRVREELVQVNPIANRYNEIGDEFHQLGQLQKAMDSFQQALATDPTNLRAQVSVASLHLETKEYLPALHGFEAALRLDDDDVMARSGLCMALLALGEQAANTDQLGEAIAYYQRVLSTNPDHPEAHQRLAQIYSQQAEEALASDESQQALQNYAQALEHAPDDRHLAERYAQVKEAHTQRLIEELIAQSEHALEEQDWTAAEYAIQQALRLAPQDPALLAKLEAVKDAPRLAKIVDLQTHAREMERLEHWDEAVEAWEACLQLQPASDEEVRHFLEHARLMQTIAGNYSLAQAAIKARHYTQAISLLQGVIALDASYKDAAELLVTCLRVRPRRELKLPTLPKLPVRWLGWAGLALILVAIGVGVASQWPRLSPLILGILPSKNPLTTQTAISSPSGTVAAREATSLPSLTPALQGITTLASAIEKFASGNMPDIQDDFSSATLQDIWNEDDGAKKATLSDGALLLDNQVPIGKGLIKNINYLLQVDLRFDNLSGEESFNYNLRLVPDPNQINSVGYFLIITPSTGEWALKALSEYQAELTTLQEGKLAAIEAGRWYELGIMVLEDKFWVYWEDQFLLGQGDLTMFGTVNCFGLDPVTAGKASLDIDNWHLWDLGSPSWMRSDWLSPDVATVYADYFAVGQGWQFGPAASELYENGRAILKTDAGEIFFTGEKFLGTNVAVDVTFSQSGMPSSASLMWYLAMDKSTGNAYGFEYFPNNGSWSIMKSENSNWERLLTGWTLITPKDSPTLITLMVNAGRVSAFYNRNFLGSAQAELPGAGNMNCLSLKSDGSAGVFIEKIGFWDLDTVQWETDDWITARPESMLLDSFTGSEGLDYFPAGTEKYENGRAVLYTTGEATHFRHNSMQGSYFALEVTYSPMTDSGSLELMLGKQEGGDVVIINYFYGNGDWKIINLENQQAQVVASGSAKPTSKGQAGTMMVVAEVNQVRLFLNQTLIGSAMIDRSVTGVDNTVGIGNSTAPAQIDITKIRFWDLITGWMRNDWITGRVPKFMDDNFQPKQGWQFGPLENVQYQDQAMILFTTGGDMNLTRKEFLGSDVAMEVTFMPLEISESAMLRWNMGIDSTTNDQFSFEYSPSTGYWMITQSKNQEWNVQLSGVTQTTQIDHLARIMVVVHGNRMTAFNGSTFLGSVDFGYPAPGLDNWFGINDEKPAATQIKIVKIRFWNLDEPEWMSPYWITSRNSSFGTDQFAANEGWEFSPEENEKYQDGMAVLYTNDYETGLRHAQIQGTNFAVSVAFFSREVPDTASLVWFLRKNTSNGNMFTFEYFPATGVWQICKVESMVLTKLVSGTTMTNPPGQNTDMLVALEGNRLSAFIGGTYLGSVESSLTKADTWNELVIRNNANTLAQVDIIKLIFWNLDQK